ncbi:MAG: hypothetical protein KF895_13030 [Parvibaculum sp.]|nr:hypothetical protein [Parvibaculum sp.]MBX3447668.1 hypothetical protein [Parvibaculaceae bacterium]MBX3506396.1 hypothetical protein [Parvibaculum sp.]
MKKTIGILGLVAGAMMLSSGAQALDSSFDAMSKAGNHKFYVWCTGGADSETTQQGANAKEAQAAAASAAGNNCWPVWQGLEG